jgi:N-methylhydantoinase B
MAVVEEQTQTLVRTALSTTVREAGDLSAEAFDRDGNILAQGVTSRLSHVDFDGRRGPKWPMML